MTGNNRHPAGTSLGGQWAPGSAAEIESPDSETDDGPTDLGSLRRSGAGPFALSNEVDSQHAQRFVSEYDELGSRARQGRPSPEHFAQLDKWAQSGFVADQARVKEAEDTFGVPFDPERPQLSFIDAGSREASAQARTQADMPDTAFAYTRDSSGDIDQVFSVGRNDFGEPTIHTSLAYNRDSRASTNYSFGDYVSTKTRQDMVKKVEEENARWKAQQESSRGFTGWVRGFFS